MFWKPGDQMYSVLLNYYCAKSALSFIHLHINSDQLPCPAKEMHHHHHLRWLPSPYLMVNVVCLRSFFSSVKATFLKHIFGKKIFSHILTSCGCLHLPQCQFSKNAALACSFGSGDLHFYRTFSVFRWCTQQWPVRSSKLGISFHNLLLTCSQYHWPVWPVPWSP